MVKETCNCVYLPDGEMILVFVESIEDPFLTHPEVNVCKLLTLGHDPHQLFQSLGSTELQKTLHTLEGHTVPSHQPAGVWEVNDDQTDSTQHRACR